MSYFNAYQPHLTQANPTPVSHSHHGGRNRRAPRVAVAPNAHKQFRGNMRSMKELVESPSVSSFRTRFELVRSFDLEDDMEFCPNLLTDNDVSVNG